MSDVDALVFDSEVATVGTLRCPRHHERFSGGMVDAALAVFPAPLW